MTQKDQHTGQSPEGRKQANKPSPTEKKTPLEQVTEKVEKLKKGLRNDEHFDSSGDPESAQEGLI